MEKTMRSSPARMPKSFRAGALVVTLLFAATNAGAAPRREDRVQKARIECISGNYQVGVRILSEVFAETDDANLIYNQGRCFEQNGKNEEAILRFEEYLRISTDLSAGEVERVRKRIAAPCSFTKRTAVSEKLW
jgi:hypothetical protein